MLKIMQSWLNGPTAFKNGTESYIRNLSKAIQKEYSLRLDADETSRLLLSACRCDEFDMVKTIDRKKYIDESAVSGWVKDRLIPSAIVVPLNDVEIIRLLIFSLEITYQMFSGGSRATTTAKGFRERSRSFETIVVDQFVGKLGEVIVKKFLHDRFGADVELDWEISTEIREHTNDIVNAKKQVSIKTSSSLAGVWAECDEGFDFGITVKCAVPRAIILQFMAECCGYSRLLDHANKIVPSEDHVFRGYIEAIRERIKVSKCGVSESNVKGFVMGYFRTKDHSPSDIGENLEYLGEVRESRYLVRMDNLKYSADEWRQFIRITGL